MYDDFSQTYDRFVNWQSRLAYEMPFITAQLERGGGDSPGNQRVLDAACGTGWHAIALAQRGYTASGADLSPAMIQHALSNAQQAGVTIDFKAAGFGELAEAFELVGDREETPRFDSLLCLGNSLPHLLEPSDLRRALADFADCLRPGGILIIQNRNFDAVLDRKERWMEPQGFQAPGEERLFVRFYDFLPEGLIGFNILALRRGEGGAWAQQIHHTLLRPQRQDDLIKALSAAGFSQIESYGDMQGHPFDKQGSGNLILVCRRR